MRTYEFVFRFRTSAQPRADITAAQVQDRIVPYLFPRGTTDVVVLGTTVTRIDNEKEADRVNPYCEDPICPEMTPHRRHA